MMDKEKDKDKDTTRSLSRVLEKVQDAETAGRFIEAHGEKKFNYFYEYLNYIIASKELIPADVIRRSGISRNYVYNILNGIKKKPGRDKVLALCIGSSMTFSETQKALEIAGLAPIYPRNDRDVWIAVAINQGVSSVLQVNLMLEKQNMEPLDV